MNHIHSELIRRIQNCQIGSEEAVKQLFKGRYFNDDVRSQLIEAVKERLEHAASAAEKCKKSNDNPMTGSWIKIESQWKECLSNLE